MSWNNGYERRKFEVRQKKQAAEYRALGMTEEQIKTMYEFDLEQFKSDRRYYEHTQEFTLNDFDEDKEADPSKSPLYHRCMELLTTTIGDVRVSTGRYAWLEDFENDDIRTWLYQLPIQDKEILTLMVDENLTQSEIAVRFGVSQPAICKKIAKFKTFLAEWL